MLIDGWTDLRLWYEDEGWLAHVQHGSDELWGVLTTRALTSLQATHLLKRLLGLSKLCLKHDNGVWTGRVQVHHLALTDAQLPALPDGDPPPSPAGKEVPMTPRPAASPTTLPLDLDALEPVVPGVRGGVSAGQGTIQATGYISLSVPDAEAAGLTAAVVIFADRTHRRLVFVSPELMPAAPATGAKLIEHKGSSSATSLRVAAKAAFVQLGEDPKKLSGRVAVQRDKAKGGVALVMRLPQPKESK